MQAFKPLSVLLALVVHIPLQFHAANLRVLPGEYVGGVADPSISDDGSVIVATAKNSEGNAVAVAWSDGVLKEVGEVEAGNWANSVHAISGDGSVVMGTTSQYPGYFFESIDGGAPTLWIYNVIPRETEVPWTSIMGGISGITRDGTVRVGGGYLWQDGDPPNVTTLSRTVDGEAVGLTFNGVSSDGGTLFGEARLFPTGSGTIKKGWVRWGNEPTDFRWIQESDSVYENWAEDASANGKVVVGSIQNAVQYGTYGFVWQRPLDPTDPNDAGTFFSLDTISSTAYQQAYAVSGDGRIIVGYEHSTDLGMDIAVMWNADNGYIPVALNTLVDDTGGFNMAFAYDVSADGSTIVGTDHYQVGGQQSVYELKLGAWDKYPPVESEFGLHANTHDWLGILEISLDPWLWCEKVPCWLHIPEATANAGQGWMYPSDHDSLQIVTIDGTDWYYSTVLKKWLYLTASGWVYLM